MGEDNNTGNFAPNPELVNLPPEKILHIKLEGYESTGDLEFFYRLKKSLASKGYKTADLFYSGFDGTTLEHGIPRVDGIFGMNNVGWKSAIKMRERTPAEYAQDYDIWCVGLYDKNQLALAKEPVDQLLEQAENLALERISFKNVEVGLLLENLERDEPVTEAVVHKNYPAGSPTDALLGVVIIEP